MLGDDANGELRRSQMHEENLTDFKPEKDRTLGSVLRNHVDIVLQLAEVLDKAPCQNWTLLAQEVNVLRKSRGFRTYSELHLTRFLQSVERTFLESKKDHLFNRRSGRKGSRDSGVWQHHTDPERYRRTQRILNDLREIMARVDAVREESSTSTIYFGVSQPALWLAEDMVRSFYGQLEGSRREKLPCKVTIVSGKSRILRRQATEQGKYHITLAFCEASSLTKPRRHQIVSLNLPPTIVINSRCPLARNSAALQWSQLAHWRVLVPAFDHSPRIFIPEEAVRHGFVMEPIQDYRDALAVVRAVQDRERVAFATCADIHRAEELRGLTALPVTDWDDGITLAAFRSDAATERSSPRTRTFVEQLERIVQNRLADFQAAICNENLVSAFPKEHIVVFHVKFASTSDHKEVLAWVPGDLEHVNVHPSGVFEAVHVCFDKSYATTRLEIPIQGRVHSTGQGTLQLSWKGAIQCPDGPHEDYFCSIVFDRQALANNSPLVGFWGGLSLSWKEPSAGYFVLMPKKRGGFLSAATQWAELNKIVEDYFESNERKHLGLQMPNPDNQKRLWPDAQSSSIDATNICK